MLFMQHLVQDSIRLKTKAFQSDSSHGFSVMNKIGWVGEIFTSVSKAFELHIPLHRQFTNQKLLQLGLSTDGFFAHI